MSDGIGLPGTSMAAHLTVPLSMAIWPPNPATPVFDWTPTCPPHFGCIGHVDPSALNNHHTHWERFGPSGVVVTLEGTAPPALCLDNLPTSRPYTPEHALLLVEEIRGAANFALWYRQLTALQDVAGR